MLVSDRYTSQKPVMRDWSRPVLPDWPAPAMGAPPKANQPGKPLFGNGEHLATVGQHRWPWPWHPDSTGG